MNRTKKNEKHEEQKKSDSNEKRKRKKSVLLKQHMKPTAKEPKKTKTKSVIKLLKKLQAVRFPRMLRSQKLQYKKHRLVPATRHPLQKAVLLPVMQ
jgi:hypothetical protein